jgi:glutamyl-tRNA synthetase
VILNEYFARHYGGRFLVRFDDTNPDKEKEEFQDAILEDLKTMEMKPDGVSYTSDFFDEIYQRAVGMIKDGKAYCDDTPLEEMRAQRMDGIASKRREDGVEENLARFAEMTKGSEDGRKWCLRAKISADIPNKAMRDPVIYRVNVETKHHRTG